MNKKTTPQANSSAGAKKSAAPKTKKKKTSPAGAGARTAKKPAGLLDRFGFLKDMSQSTTGIVHKAAAILEDEIAAGIVAARKVEDAFARLSPSKKNAAQPDELLARFRKDAHDVVDLLIDLVGSTARLMNNVILNAANAGASSATAPDASNGAPAGNMKVIAAEKTVPPGDTATASMSISNDSDTAIDDIGLSASDLTGPAGGRIASGKITFSPAVCAIGPGETATVSIGIETAVDCAAGTYTGFIYSAQSGNALAVLSATIEQG